MIALPLAVAIVCLTGWFVWQNVYVLAGRLLALRERRLDADLARERQDAAAHERATRDLRGAILPDDIESMARQWAEGGDPEGGESVRARARELFGLLRDDNTDDATCWDRVRQVLLLESETGLPGSPALPGMGVVS